MRVLTDTHALVWALQVPEMLGAEARKIMDTAELTASVANLWELCIKSGKKGALVNDPVVWWHTYVARAELATLPIRLADVLSLSALPEIHKEPFDRILVAQCISEGIPLVTKDERLRLYGIQTIW